MSVVIPSHDHERFVAAAIASVLRQTHRPLELVIVDDGSTDASRDVIAAAIASHDLDRVLLIDQDNAGTHVALERGLEAARGDVLAILNSDDVYHPDRLSRMLAALPDAATGLVFSRIAAIDAAGAALPAEHGWVRWYEQGLAAIPSCPTLGFALLVDNTSVTSSNFVFHRALRERVAAFSAHRFCHDWGFLMRTVLVAEPIVVPEVLLQYRVHAGNTTHRLRGVQEAELADALDRYLAAALAAAPANVLAPSPAHWPHLLPHFLDTRPFMTGTTPLADHVRPELLAALHAACGRYARASVT